MSTDLIVSGQETEISQDKEALQEKTLSTLLMKQVEILSKAWGHGGEHILKYVAKNDLQKFNNNWCMTNSSDSYEG